MTYNLNNSLHSIFITVVYLQSQMKHLHTNSKVELNVAQIQDYCYSINERKDKNDLIMFVYTFVNRQHSVSPNEISQFGFRIERKGMKIKNSK